VEELEMTLEEFTEVRNIKGVSFVSVGNIHECSGCGSTTKKFSNPKSSPKCNKCSAAYMKNWRKKNKEKETKRLNGTEELYEMLKDVCETMAALKTQVDTLVSQRDTTFF
jgi:ribosomal protein S27E